MPERKQPIRAIIWAAVSTKAQANEDKESLPQQEEQARNLCAERNWQIVDVLRVPGHSRNYFDFQKLAGHAAKKGIDAFHKIEQHWEKGDFDILIVRDGDRFARTQSLHAYFTERTILEARANIWSFADGEINETNYSGWTALSGYKASNENRAKVKKYHEGMDGNAKRGVLGGAIPPTTHRLVRDPKTGRPKKLVLDETKRLLFDDLAELFLAGVSYSQLEPELFKRGHINEKGKQYYYTWGFHILFNPPTWGNLARHYRKHWGNHSQYGAWAWDPNRQSPDGVKIFYNVVDPIYEGELALRIQSELIRRSEAIKGRARPHNTYKFTGLVICDECGYSLCYHTKRETSPNYRALYCPAAKQRKAHMPVCNNIGLINEKKIQAVIDRYLRAYVAMRKNNPILDSQALEGMLPERTPVDTRDDLKQKLQQTKDRARIVIREQISAPSGLQDIYREELESLNEEIERVEAQLRVLEREIATRAMQDETREQAAQELPEEIAEFWTWDSIAINQLLRRFLGDGRFAVRNHEVVSVKERPIWR